MTTEVEVWQSWLFQQSTILIYHIQSTKFYRASKGPQYFTTVMLVSIWKNECSFARHDSIHLFSFYFVYKSLGKKPVTDCVTTTHQKCCIYSSWSRILKPTNYASQSQVQGSFKKFLTVSNTIFYAVLKVSLDLWSILVSKSMWLKICLWRILLLLL